MQGETGSRAIPIGVNNFRKLRDKGYCYVDKSELISDIVRGQAEVYLFTRPRRFGKSLNLSMLNAFFNLEYKDNNWFDGLKVSNHRETDVHRNAYPVICLDMKDLSVNGYGSFVQDLNLKIARLFQNYRLDELLHLTVEENVDIYKRGRSQKLNESELKASVSILCQILHDCYGTSPVVLIDEYDNPINRAYNKADYGNFLEFLRIFYSSILKNNEHLEFAVVTGVMQIGKETIFSGLNNLQVDNIFSERFDERYGFTPAEVKDLCRHYGHPDKYGEAREWYDGYRFGNADIYNPWSVLNYVDTGFKPAAYWAGTSGNDIIDTLIDLSTSDTYGELQTLAEGRPLVKTLSDRIALRDIFGNVDAVFSVMAVSGYFKAVPLGDDDYELSIPNIEMRKVFSSMVLDSIHSEASRAFRWFFEGMVNADTGRMKEGLDLVLRKNIPFILLTKEADYPLLIAAAAMCLLGRYTVRLEEESGNGRADMTLRPNSHGLPNIVVEFKKTKDPGETERFAESALAQIKEREYVYGMEGRTILYDICFHGKDSVIVMEETVSSPQ